MGWDYKLLLLIVTAEKEYDFVGKQKTEKLKLNIFVRANFAKRMHLAALREYLH